MSIFRSWRTKRRIAKLDREIQQIEWRQLHANDKCIRCLLPRHAHKSLQACSLFKGQYD